MLRKPSWFPKPWLHQQQTKKAVNKSKHAGWSQKSNNIQGLHQDQDVIPRLNERRYEEEKKEKGGKKKQRNLRYHKLIIYNTRSTEKPVMTVSKRPKELQLHSFNKSGLGKHSRHIPFIPLTEVSAEIKKGVVWGYKLLQASNLLEQ